jgi:hypothetical protein
MNRTDCRAVRREIDESELGQRLSQQVETHLARCAACGEFRSERLRLRELVGSLAPVTAPADFDMRLRARIARENSARSRQPYIFRFVMSTPGIAVAALVVTLIAGLVWFKQRPPVLPAHTASNGGQESPKTPSVPSDGPTNIYKPAEPVVATVVPGETLPKRPNGFRPASVKSSANATNDFFSSPAESVRLNQDRAGEVSLSAPVNPMVVTVRDERGSSHKILLPPITFGSQRLTDSRVPVSMTNSRDW